MFEWHSAAAVHVLLVSSSPRPALTCVLGCPACHQVVADDGVVRWHSKAIVDCKSLQRCSVPVADAGTIELRVRRDASEVVGVDDAGSLSPVMVAFHRCVLHGSGLRQLDVGTIVAVQSPTAAGDAPLEMLLVGSVVPTPAHSGPPRRTIRIRTLNTETGVPGLVDVPVSRATTVSHMYGTSVTSAVDLLGFLRDTSESLTCLLTKQCLCSLLRLWPATVPMTMASVGGDARFVSLLKLVAASALHQARGTGATATAGSSKPM